MEQLTWGVGGTGTTLPLDFAGPDEFSVSRMARMIDFAETRFPVKDPCRDPVGISRPSFYVKRTVGLTLVFDGDATRYRFFMESVPDFDWSGIFLALRNGIPLKVALIRDGDIQSRPLSNSWSICSVVVPKQQ